MVNNSLREGRTQHPGPGSPAGASWPGDHSTGQSIWEKLPAPHEPVGSSCHSARCVILSCHACPTSPNPICPHP